ncbi:hypothetical protein BX286_6687 [Streptomyces sp. 3211.6]|nr:hypothetical protein BX286_6687 [Streptomyces sp. 3211.6]RPF29979.1 hypothetical protein EDD96_6529 [Streptomyces sp. Ag109_G2-6]
MRSFTVLSAAAGCLLLTACSGGAAGAASAQPAAVRTDPSRSPSAGLPQQRAAGEVPDTARLRELVLRPGEDAGVPDPAYGIRDVHPSEFGLVPGGDAYPAACRTMWALIGHKGAQAAIAQTFTSKRPGEPSVNFLASHAGTGATTAFAQLREAASACPQHGSDGRTATVATEDLHGAGFPEDAIRIRITVHEEGSSEPDDISDRIVARVGACIVDMSGLWSQPQTRLAEAPVLRQIERLRAGGQGL